MQVHDPPSLRTVGPVTTGAHKYFTRPKPNGVYENSCEKSWLNYEDNSKRKNFITGKPSAIKGSMKDSSDFERTFRGLKLEFF